MQVSLQSSLHELPHLAPIIAVSFNGIVARISIKLGARNRLVTLCEGDLSRLKVYKELLSYVEGKPFEFIHSFYTAL